MDKKIEDYLKFYLGCECIVERSDLFMRNRLVIDGSKVKIDGNLIEHISNINADHVVIKPILRPLSDMSDDEAVECAKIIARRPTHFTAVENADITRHENSIDIVFIDNLEEAVNIGNNGDALLYRHVDINHRIIEQRCYNQAGYFHYLLSKHFDIFGLIGAGLAIDKTTLK